MPEHPKVFISYSHDSPEHKRWVSELGAKLRHNGIDAILDQWDLGPGDDITLFMESGLKNSDRVLVICTDTYVSKANAGEGGVLNFRRLKTLTRDEFGGNFEKPSIQISPFFVKGIVARFSSFYARQGQPDIDSTDFVTHRTAPQGETQKSLK